jgi:hypothetical protein
MALGTLDRTPPPFFRQGPTALTRLVFFAALAIFLMVADTRFRVVEPLRAGLALALMPLQSAAAVPLEIWHGGGDYLRGLRRAQADEAAARATLAAQSAHNSSFLLSPMATLYCCTAGRSRLKWSFVRTFRMTCVRASLRSACSRMVRMCCS